MQEGEHRTLKNERFFYQQPRIKVSSLYLARFFFLILVDYMVVNRKRPYLAFETVEQQLKTFFFLIQIDRALSSKEKGACQLAN